MNKEQQEYFKNARHRFLTEVDSFLIAYDNVVNENAELQKEVERLKEKMEQLGCHSYYANNLSMYKECLNCGKLPTEHYPNQ
jgi:regulator of replication initiation timing